MSLLDQDLETLKTASNFQFSATKLADLGASEYTLVVIACDASSSVSRYHHQLETMLKTVLKACQKSDRKENLMLRLTQFSNEVTELHGFKLLSTIQETDYNAVLNIGGMTALHAAAVDGVESVTVYGKQLMDQEILTNAIVFVITDGVENNSRGITADKVAQSVNQSMLNEALESITVVLVGVTEGDMNLNQHLMLFAKEAGITQYIDIGNATAGKLAKLAQFVSQSISSTSQALGSGGPSKPLSFSV